jgi:hypothetical protein
MKRVVCAHIKPERERSRRRVRGNRLAVHVVQELVRARSHVARVELRERRAEAGEVCDEVGRDRGAGDARERQQRARDGRNAHV